MTILALELSSARGSVAWWTDEGDSFEREFANDRKHSGSFFHALQEMGERLTRAERIVVGLGPGSYAGVRIAIATAIGLQVAHGAELCGLPSICGLPVEVEKYAAVGDARRHSFYFAEIEGGKIIEDFELHSKAEFEARLRHLDSRKPVYASEALPQFPRVSLCYPSAMSLAHLGRKKPELCSGPPLEPIYLRGPHITVPKFSSK
jgi:tRNA threonylcarbamoyl adenosine modification protein YeaZ